ncbi:hypothetical protein FJT64_006305 [Amphibalanus amphitrite]|uniref:Uncharacterized protein n=1 Tax=Amphibalanus amphitrite TaxID=1232801 RepID=A0A6A4VXY8_AMPAM|nr:hypothetical protein FJT64_006305 [Amphibalanus amphitrite]
MRTHGGPERYRLVVVVGVLLVVMTAAIVGVTVWVVTQQTAGDAAPRRPSETVVNYVGWEEVPPPESDSHIISGDQRQQVSASTAEPTTTRSGLDSAQIQASLAQLGPNRQLQLDQLQPGDYSQNVADVMKQLQQQQDQLGQQTTQRQQQPIRHGGTIEGYGVLETYQHDLPPAWPSGPGANPDRMGQSFEGVAQPYDPAFSAPGSGGAWSGPGRQQLGHEGQHQEGMYRPGDRYGERPADPANAGRGGQPMGLRPFRGESDRAAFARRGEQERPRRPPFRSRDAANRTYAAADDPATNAGLDLAVSGWSAFSFGMFLLKKLVQIMGYGRQSRMVPDESSMFLRALDVAGKIVGFDATEELSVLGEGLSEARSFPETGPEDTAEPEMSRVDLVNGLFRVGLNMVNLFTAEGELNISECLWGAYCEDLQRRSADGTVDGIVAKVNSIGLKLIRGDVRDYIGVGQMMDMVRDFEGSQCQKLFPACHGRQAVRFVGDLFGGA